MFFERCFVLRLTCQSNRFPTDLKISNLGRSLRIFHPQQSPQAAQNGTCPRGCLCRCFLVDTLTQPTTSGCFHCWQLSIVARNELGSCKSKQDFSSSARLLQSLIRAFGVQTRLSIHKDQRLEIQRHIFYVQDAICSNFESIQTRLLLKANVQPREELKDPQGPSYWWWILGVQCFANLSICSDDTLFT